MTPLKQLNGVFYRKNQMIKRILIQAQQVLILFMATVLFIGIFSVNLMLFWLSFAALIFSALLMRKAPKQLNLSLVDTWRNSRLLVTMII